LNTGIAPQARSNSPDAQWSGCGWGTAWCRPDRYALPVFVGGRRIAGLAVVIAMGSAGCSGSSNAPRTLPPLSTTPAAIASTAPPENPKAAAVAVVREYFLAKNMAVAEMDPTPLAAIETRTCPCRKFLDSIRQTAREGQTYFGRSHMRSAAVSGSASETVQVLATYDTTSGGTRDGSGEVVYRGPARVGVTAIFTVRRVRGRWLVSDIVNVRRGNRA
jgi:hypothetical protein